MRLEREAGLFDDDFLCPFEELDDLIGRRSGIGGDVVRIGRVELGVSFDQAVDSAALEEFYGRDAVEIDECKCGTGWIVGLFAPFDDPEGLLPFGQLSDIAWMQVEGRVNRVAWVSRLPMSPSSVLLLERRAPPTDPGIPTRCSRPPRPCPTQAVIK